MFPHRGTALLAAVALAAAAALAGCTAGGQRVSPSQVATTEEAPSGLPGGTVQSGARIVLLDPGHNGGNADDPARINEQVPDGRGGTKACNTTGTATDAGFPEHRFAWDVAKRVRAQLEAGGVVVMMTRDDNKGVGPCVDERGKKAELVNADAVISIHADGAAPQGRGFHVAYAAPPVSQSQGQPSVSLANALRDGMRAAGLQTSTYAGRDGLSPRKDLAGLNLARRPAALVECANMRNPDEAKMVSSAVGRQRIAEAISRGILAWLAGN